MIVTRLQKRHFWVKGCLLNSRLSWVYAKSQSRYDSRYVLSLALLMPATALVVTCISAEPAPGDKRGKMNLKNNYLNFPISSTEIHFSASFVSYFFELFPQFRFKLPKVLFFSVSVRFLKSLKSETFNWKTNFKWAFDKHAGKRSGTMTTTLTTTTYWNKQTQHMKNRNLFTPLEQYCH